MANGQEDRHGPTSANSWSHPPCPLYRMPELGAEVGGQPLGAGVTWEPPTSLPMYRGATLMTWPGLQGSDNFPYPRWLQEQEWDGQAQRENMELGWAVWDPSGGLPGDIFKV